MVFKIEFDTGDVKYASNHFDAVMALKDAEGVIWKQRSDGSWKFVLGSVGAFNNGMVSK